MSETETAGARLAEAARPVARRLDLGGWLTAVASLLWLGQAALAAALLSALIAGAFDRTFAVIAVGGFTALGILRAMLQERADRILAEAADAVLARERAALVAREARRSPVAAGPGSAEIAALAGEKLATLVPHLTRHRPAQLRVATVPVAILAVTAWHSWIAALILLVAGPMIPLFMALVGMAAREASERQMDEIGNLNGLLLDRLHALVDIRLLDAGDAVVAAFADRAEALRRQTMEVLRIAFLSSTVLELFSALGVAMVAVYVGFSLLGTITFGAWGAPLAPGAGIFLLLLAPDFFQPLRDLAGAWHDKAAAEAVARDLVALEAQRPMDILGLAAPALSAPAALNGSDILRTRDLAVEIAPGTRLTFPDLALRPGESVALVGPSGTGKSTLLAAIAGLVPVACGELEVDGRPLDRTTATAWRSRVGWVPQSPHFFAASLRENLRMAAPEATEARIGAALALARADEVVAHLPRGLLTRLGETGTGVSGGEARRLMVARAALTGPALVLADEPTANLDAETAEAVTAGLLRLARKGAALLVATHDTDLAARLDRQIVLGEAP